VHNIVMNGAMNVIISSLQKEFYLSSKESGTYVSVYDIGSLISSLIIPILGARGSKPVWIGFGMLMLCCGCFLNVLPHFIKPRSSLDTMHQASRLFDNSSSYMPQFVDQQGNSIELCQNASTSAECEFKPELAHFNVLKYILYAANIVNGLSSASMTTLALSYIEEVAPKESTSLYEAIYYATGAFGMGVGFMITSQFLRINSDVDQVKSVPEWFTPSHPNWVGAWWLPFIIFGAVAFIFAVTIAMFPKKPHSPHNGTDSEATNMREIEKHIDNDVSESSIGTELDDEPACGDEAQKVPLKPPRDDAARDELSADDHNLLKVMKDAGSTMSVNNKKFYTDETLHEFDPKSNNSKRELAKKTKQKFSHMLASTFQLFKNPTFVCIVIVAAIEGLLQNSFLAFASLFLEYQYRLASGAASFMLGAISIPPLIIGSFVSGFLIKKFDWKIRQCLKFLCCVLCANILVYSGFLLHCKQVNLVLGSSVIFPNQKLFNEEAKVCYEIGRESCECNLQTFKPLCLKGADDIVFQSPCVAGCQNHSPLSNRYFNCTVANCFVGEQKEIELTDGICEASESCNGKLFATYVTIFCLMLINSMTFIPFVKVTIGCVSDSRMNAIALGIKQLAMTGIGTIPGPILFGAVIDTACKYWYTDCFNQSVCKVYNNDKFSFRFGFMGMGFKCVCAVLTITALLCLKEEKSDEANAETAQTK